MADLYNHTCRYSEVEGCGVHKRRLQSVELVVGQQLVGVARRIAVTAGVAAIAERHACRPVPEYVSADLRKKNPVQQLRNIFMYI
jgi:hypothetical protein